MGQTLEQLKQQQTEINKQFIQTLCKDSKHIKMLADNMAEAATNIQGQGYIAFVNAREAFLAEMDRVLEDYSFYVCADPSARNVSPK